MKRVHFIAIGGSAMHNLAIALHKKGNFKITGSDDEIFSPSKDNLEKYGLLPDKIGWDESRINNEIDEIILGMHAREDNPELLKAQELGIKIYSYPEYLYEQSKDKTRIVIGGSHGKTSITAMLLHVFQKNNIDCDYMVGAKLEGFDVMVKISKEAKYMIIEGDEYLTSPIDRRPKFHLYKPHLAVLSGIAWDHINVFPTFENYVDQFRIFIETIDKNGFLAYSKNDDVLNNLAEKTAVDLNKKAYDIPQHEIDKEGNTFIIHGENKYKLQVFGNHNLMNINAARLICNQIGIDDNEFYKSISSFKGASNRLELLAENSKTKIFKDFAHSPSKLKATTSAVCNQFQNKKIYAVMELHTFSSLNAKFLKEYKDSMKDADIAIVYFNPHTIEHKKLEKIDAEDIKKSFNRNDLLVFNNSEKLKNHLINTKFEDSILLLMSSGNFDGINLKELADELIT